MSYEGCMFISTGHLADKDVVAAQLRTRVVLPSFFLAKSELAKGVGAPYDDFSVGSHFND
jgi:hypothetical protein